MTDNCPNHDDEQFTDPWIGYRDGVAVEFFNTRAGAELALTNRRVQAIAPRNES
jgi:hypothetical protein